MWSFVDEPWQYRILDQMPPGVDLDQLARTLTLTPSERIDAVVELMEVGESLQKALARKDLGR
jgi:hypothetical protein